MDNLLLKNLVFAVLAFVLACGSTFAGQTYVVTSPDEQAQVEFVSDDGQLDYTVTWRNSVVLLPSRLSLLDDQALKLIGTEEVNSDTVWNPVWGQFSEVHDRYSGLVFQFATEAGERVLLECRVFNDGIGLRYSSDSKTLTGVDKVNFRSEYHWPTGNSMYWPSNESEPVGPISTASLEPKQKLGPQYPVVMDTGKSVFAAVLESDLFSAKPFKSLRFDAIDSENSTLVGRSPANVQGQPWQTPWRVLLFGSSPGDLLVSTTPLNLAVECQLKDTSWIQPGRCMWDWRVHGYQVGNFKYGINTASYLRFIDFAAENNVQYFLIDDAWFDSAKEGKLEASEEIDLPKIMDHARERGVGVLLYYDRKKGNLPNDELFPELSRLGAVGTKYGFHGNDAPFTRDAITKAAEQKLLINFHDGPCPMTGVERTLPNAVTREYCHAQLDRRKAFTPTAFLKMAMINGLSGPLDQANGFYDLDGINTIKRDKTLKKLGTYPSTVVSETARVLVIYSGLICLPDAPEEYEKKDDLFDFIRRMPTTWDETRIVNSRIGHSITTARRKGQEWFVGSVINEAGGELPIELDFLEPGLSYDVTYYEDAPETDCNSNREAYQIRSGTIQKGETIAAKLAPGGGHCLWIRPEAAK